MSRRRSRRQSAEQGPINMKSTPKDGKELWDEDGLPKIPQNEIFVGDEDEPKFRGRSSTIGNGEIPRMARQDDEDESKQTADKSKIMIPVVLKFTTPSKSPPTKVFVSGSMTDWKSVEMAVCKGETDFNLILDCAPGKYYY